MYYSDISNRPNGFKKPDMEQIDSPHHVGCLVIKKKKITKKKKKKRARDASQTVENLSQNGIFGKTQNFCSDFLELC
jgi:hypothetical protein